MHAPQSTNAWGSDRDRLIRAYEDASLDDREKKPSAVTAHMSGSEDGNGGLDGDSCPTLSPTSGTPKTETPYLSNEPIPPAHHHSSCFATATSSALFIRPDMPTPGGTSPYPPPISSEIGHSYPPSLSPSATDVLECKDTAISRLEAQLDDLKRKNRSLVTKNRSLQSDLDRLESERDTARFIGTAARLISKSELDHFAGSYQSLRFTSDNIREKAVESVLEKYEDSISSPMKTASLNARRKKHEHGSASRSKDGALFRTPPTPTPSGTCAHSHPPTLSDGAVTVTRYTESFEPKDCPLTVTEPWYGPKERTTHYAISFPVGSEIVTSIKKGDVLDRTEVGLQLALAKEQGGGRMSLDKERFKEEFRRNRGMAKDGSPLPL